MRKHHKHSQDANEELERRTDYASRTQKLLYFSFITQMMVNLGGLVILEGQLLSEQNFRHFIKCVLLFLLAPQHLMQAFE